MESASWTGLALVVLNHRSCSRTELCPQGTVASGTCACAESGARREMWPRREVARAHARHLHVVTAGIDSFVHSTPTLRNAQAFHPLALLCRKILLSHNRLHVSSEVVHCLSLVSPGQHEGFTAPPNSKSMIALPKYGYDVRAHCLRNNYLFVHAPGPDKTFWWHSF